MRRIFCFIGLSLCATLHATDRSPGSWHVIEGCRRIESPANDADSFQVKHGDDESRFRLYFVDAPESSDRDQERLRDQARYFSISEQQVTMAGRSAQSLTRRFLSGEFTIITQWKDARGGKDPCYFAIVQKDGRFLSAELVRNGLARIYGLPPTERWPGGLEPRAYLGRLKDYERAAQQKLKGIWSTASASAQLAGLKQLGATTRPQSLENNAPLLASDSATNHSDKINVNTAGIDQLKSLPGIGDALAARIIEARPIESIEALAGISGISLNTVEGFRDRIVVQAPPPPAKTIAFYLNDQTPHLEQEITVTVASVAASNMPAPDSFRTVYLETANDGISGGGVPAFIPDEFYESFIRYYQTPGRDFTAFLHQQDDMPVLVYRRK